MRLLFERPDSTKMQFHLADLNKEDLNVYTKLILRNGGKVETKRKPNVLTFTFPEYSINHRDVYNIKFINDCIKKKKILDIDAYYIGDLRMIIGCPISKMIDKSKTCLLNRLLYNDNEVLVIPIQQMSQKLKATVNQKKDESVIELDSTLEENVENNQTEKTQQTTSNLKSNKRNLVNKLDSTLRENVENNQIEKTQQTTSNLKSNKRNLVNNNSEVHEEPAKKRKFFPVKKNAENVQGDTREQSSIFDTNGKDIFDDNSEQNSEAVGNMRTMKKNVDKLLRSPAVREWVENLNKTRVKDKEGYPRAETRNFTPWESSNMVSLLEFTNTYNRMLTDSFWETVSEIKLVSKSRSYRSLGTHMKLILRNLNEMQLKPEIKMKLRHYESEIKKKRAQ